MSHPVDPVASRVPPLPAIVAAPLAVLSAFAPGLFFLVAIGFSGGRLSGLEWLLLVVPLGLSLGLLVGAALLLLGRSWRVVAVWSSPGEPRRCTVEPAGPRSARLRTR